MRKLFPLWLPILLVCLATAVASAQSFRVQCPTSPATHPTAANSEPDYTAPTYTSGQTYESSGAGHVNGAIKCQQISGGDGYSTMGDGTQTYMFSFGPLSGLGDMANGRPGTEFPSVFNGVYGGTFAPGDPATSDGAGPGPNPASGFRYNGAVGLIPDATGNTAAPSAGHVDPRPIEDVGVMNGNIPAPLMAIDEDDEFFLTLTNVGMIMRPDLFEQHTVHFHGYPNASSFYDGVPDASVAINIGASFTYYYLSPDAGTYFWHCHITPPEHLQMGMVGQIYVRSRQNRVPSTTTLYAALQQQEADPRTACRRPNDNVSPTVTTSPDILCSNPLPTVNTLVSGGAKYAYNDGDGSTAYDVEYPIQIHGFDPNFHFVGMTFNPENFVDMKDKYFLLNGRSYPDTVTAGPLKTQSADGVDHFFPPLPPTIQLPAGKKAPPPI